MKLNENERFKLLERHVTYPELERICEEQGYRIPTSDELKEILKLDSSIRDRMDKFSLLWCSDETKEKEYGGLNASIVDPFDLDVGMVDAHSYRRGVVIIDKDHIQVGDIIVYLYNNQIYRGRVVGVNREICIESFDGSTHFITREGIIATRELLNPIWYTED